MPNPKYTGELELGEACLAAAEEPDSVDEALEQALWRKAMEEEIKCILDNDTWELESLPAGHRAIGLKWVYKVKRDPAGNVMKYKARLVAKGYAQRQGIDFDEVFAPVTRIETVRLLLAVAAHRRWKVHHMDVKSAFLNGELEEEVYVHQPAGFVDSKNPGKVLKLKKALYGLRQAPRAWNAKLDASMVSLGFERRRHDHALYRRSDGDEFLIVGVYVDDLIITGTSAKTIDCFKSQMHELFQMSDLGLLSYYLGIEVTQEDDRITMSQSSYAKKIVQVAGMENCNSCHVLMENRLKLRKLIEGEVIDASLYRSLVGSLRYLVNTRPDLGFAVGFISRYMEAPGKEHWAALKQVLRYVQGSANLGLVFKASSESETLTGYSDSDHAGDLDDRKSTSGQVFFLGSSPITWASQKQKCVAISSCEAEYMAASTASCQALWLRNLLAEVVGEEPQKVRLFCDNQSAIALCKNPVYHDRSKHIDTRYHHIRECIEDGKVDVFHVRTEGQVADILTKSLGRTKFAQLRQMLGVIKVS
jgi:hypothetical protein